VASRQRFRLAILVTAFTALTVLVGTGATDAVDSAVLGLLLPLRTSAGESAFQWLTLIGSPIVSAGVAIAFGVLLVARRDRGGWLVVLFFVGIALELVLKQVVFQPGPPSELVRDSALLPTLRDLTPYTYPGGHVMRVAFLSAMIGSRYPRLRPPLASLAALVAFGRIYLAAGWAADIAGGVLLGLALATVAAVITERARARRPAPGVALVTP
jgi:membrane-associated phospholipid phosphatase